jgi:hypothetical protein
MIRRKSRERSEARAFGQVLIRIKIERKQIEKWQSILRLTV